MAFLGSFSPPALFRMCQAREPSGLGQSKSWLTSLQRNAAWIEPFNLNGIAVNRLLP
jgi:hypothetical protein